MPEPTLDDIERSGYETVVDLLGDDLDADPPAEPLRAAVQRLASHAHDEELPFGYFLAAAAWADDELDDVAELEDAAFAVVWLSAAASVVEPVGDPDAEVVPADVLDEEDWLAIVTGLLADGPGAVTTPASLLRYLEAQEELTAEEREEVEPGLGLLCSLWQALDVLDDDQRLTPLGEWGVPRALLEAWDETDELPHDEEAAALVESVKALWDDEPASVTTEMWTAAAVAAYVQGENLGATVADDGWPAFAERMHMAVAGTPLAAGPSHLRAMCAEHAGDVAEQQRWVDTALAADPQHLWALRMAAELAGAAGDARRARDLLRRTGADRSDRDLATYETFARRPEGPQSRNAPCACGSGRKFKLCCGARVGHPLSERSGWMWAKAMHFLLRPPSAEVLLHWARRMHGVEDDTVDADIVRTAGADPLAWDFALFDGGVLARLLDVRGPLLPEDERDVMASWLDTKRRAYEVVATRPGASITMRDVLTGTTVEVRERTASREARPGELVLARLLPVGDVTVFGFVMAVPRLQRAALVDVLSGSTDVGPLLRWLQQTTQPAQLHNTEGEELVLVTQRWRLAEDGWRRLADTLEPDGDDGLAEIYDDGHGDRWVRGHLTRARGVVTVTTNSAQRADRLAELMRLAGGSLVDEERTPIDEAVRRPRAVPDPVEMTPEAAAALEEFVRHHERRWVDEQIPMFGNRTPREMVRTAEGRRELEAFLDDLAAEAALAGPGPGLMDPGRIRELLGLPVRLPT